MVEELLNAGLNRLGRHPASVALAGSGVQFFT
jgi:hypothetical protein